MPRRNRIKPHERFSINIPCNRKRRFASENDALAAVEQAELDGIAPALSAYNCPYCSGWHLSSTPSKGLSNAG